MAVISNIDISIKAQESGSGSLATIFANHSDVYSAAYPSGTSASTADMVYSISATTSTTTPVAYDLAGSLTGALGNTLTFAKIVAIYVINNSTTAADILTVGAGSNPLLNWIIATGDGVKVGAGGAFFISAPIAPFSVTAGTGDVLTLTSASGSIPYKLIVIGRSA